MLSNRLQMTSKCGKNKKVAQEAWPSVSLMFLPHFDVFCDLLLNKHMATWNLFVKVTKKIVCVNNEATLLITFRFFCMIIMMSTVLGESPFMLSSLGHLKDPKNILIIFTRRTVLKRMCPRPIWFTYVGFNVANEYKRKKNGYGYTKASLTSD